MPISVSCPGCGKEYNVRDEAAGKKFKCRECETIVDVPGGDGPASSAFGSPASEPDNPFGNMDFGGPPPVAPVPRRSPMATRMSDRETALERLSGPAVGMMICAGLGMFGVFGFLAIVVMVAVLDPNMGADERVVVIVVWSAILLFLTVMLCLVLFGALKMKRGESYGLALTASIIASIPCLTPCLCMPFGIWGIAVLSDSDVKEAFHTSNEGHPP